MDPDPYSEYGSGSRKLLNTDPDPQHWVSHQAVSFLLAGSGQWFGLEKGATKKEIVLLGMDFLPGAETHGTPRD